MLCACVCGKEEQVKSIKKSAKQSSEKSEVQTKFVRRKKNVAWFKENPRNFCKFMSKTLFVGPLNISASLRKETRNQFDAKFRINRFVCQQILFILRDRPITSSVCNLNLHMSNFGFLLFEKLISIA